MSDKLHRPDPLQINGWSWTVDPLGKFDNLPAGRIMPACGILPLWLSPFGSQDPIEYIDSLYLYGLHPQANPEGYVFDGVTGTYRYPGDPIQIPLMRGLGPDGVVCYVYQNSMFIVNYADGSYIVARAD